MPNSSIVRGASALLALASIVFGTGASLAQEPDPASRGTPDHQETAGAEIQTADTPGSAEASEAPQPVSRPESPPEAAPASQNTTPPSAHLTQPAPPAPVPAPAEVVQLPSTAQVQVYVNRAGAWLELRDDLAGGPWRRVCDAPCNQVIQVYGTEARVNGPRMTPSNQFRIEPGSGAARFKVRAGSAAARRWGTALLAAGLPLSALGFAGYGYGEMANEPALGIAGAVALGVGAGAVATSFVLVSRGSTRVRDARGRRIAAAPANPRF